ncbi:MAG: integrase core domain-containing protein [Nitrospirales bacterium]|nr:integrase core domain-containing protein [Nitrospirales bacterium]
MTGLTMGASSSAQDSVTDSLTNGVQYRTTPVLRSDNGLIFQSRRFRQACRDYRLHQEFITPYTPEQNGRIERFFRSFKEECVWQHHFEG